MNTRCHIELFGIIRVVQQDREIVRFRTHKAASMLAFLALHPGQDQARERLVELFWPDLESTAGRDNLSTALSSLRRQLEPTGTPYGSVLQADRQCVRLNPECVTTDVAEFEQTLRIAGQTDDPNSCRALLEKAVSLYRGELLPGCYEDWALAEQLRLRDCYADALQRLVTVLLRAGAWEAALEAANRLLAADPYEEIGCQAKMQACAALGRPGTALETYRMFATSMRDDLGIAPNPTLCELAERIRHDPTALAGIETPRPTNTQTALEPRTSRSAPPIAQPSTPIPALPLYLTRFFGREADLERLTAMLRSVPQDSSESPTDASYESTTPPSLRTYREEPPPFRLITLTGPGGVGKTRLAVALAERLVASFLGGVWFVSLAEVTHPHLIPFAITHALKPALAPKRDPLEEIVITFGQEPALLILDSFEHLLRETKSRPKVENQRSGAAMLVRLLLERAPGLTCVITSRCRLGLSGEQEFPVMALTAPNEIGAPEKLLEYGSIALYTDRAQAVRPDFALSDRNAGAVVALCRRLEGMPLAIEMAAAWASALSPARILEQLERQWDFLVGRHQDLPPRHRSLRAVAEWSYQLLSSELRSFYARLSVFRGGWDLEAAEEVAEGGTHTLDYLNRLQEQSLILCEVSDERTRYRLFESLREYAWEQVSSEERTALARRHAVYFQNLAEAAEAYYPGDHAKRWLDRLEREHDNLRAAIRWSLEDSDVAPGIRIALALHFFWSARGHFQDEETFLQHTLERRSQASPSLQARLLLETAFLHTEQAEIQSQLETALTLFRTLKNPQGEAATYRSLAHIPFQAGDFRKAQEYCLRALAIFEEMNQELEITWTLAGLAEMHRRMGEFTEARACLERSLELAKRIGDKGSIAKLGIALGAIGIQQGDIASARVLLQQSYVAFLERGEKWNTADALFNLGCACQAQGEYEEAKSHLDEALAIFRELKDTTMQGSVLNALVRLALAGNDLVLAESLNKEAGQLT